MIITYYRVCLCNQYAEIMAKWDDRDITLAGADPRILEKGGGKVREKACRSVVIFILTGKNNLEWLNPLNPLDPPLLGQELS